MCSIALKCLNPKRYITIIHCFNQMGEFNHVSRNGEFLKRRRGQTSSLPMFGEYLDGLAKSTKRKSFFAQSPVAGSPKGGKFHPGKHRPWRLAMLALDVLAVVYFFWALHFFFFYDSKPDGKLTHSTPLIPPAIERNLEKSGSAFSKGFEFDTAACGEIEMDDVEFTLVVHLDDSKMWMLGHHCVLWGVSAPMSVAIWTNEKEDAIIEQLKSLKCDVDNLEVQILRLGPNTNADYPINKLRNLALSGVKTSHVISVDIDFWSSADLFDSLNEPAVRAAFSKDPKLGVVIPAFQLQGTKCDDEKSCTERYLQWMPKDFEDLVVSLSSGKVMPYEPTSYTHQGSTDYRQWMHQGHGELSEIPCISSNEYQPYIAVRLCDALPPFQESFVGHGRNNMSWMMHLKRVGYDLQQLGGSFLTHFPHPVSTSLMESDESDAETLALKKTEAFFEAFQSWLYENISDSSRVKDCEVDETTD